MTSFRQSAPGLEQLTIAHDRDARATVVVALHDTRLGPAHGGIRRAVYPDLDHAVADARALAEAMTWKCALAGVPAGGGKAVLLDHPGLDRPAAYRFVGRLVEQLGGRFFTGPDVGTTAADLREVQKVTRRVAGPDGDGPGDLAAATAQGVFAALVALRRHQGGELPGCHVAVQGLGAVGLELATRLAAAGARLTVADVDPARVALARQRFAATVVEPAQITAVPCEVFAPCALGGVLDLAVAATLPAAGVCGAANNILATAAVGQRLFARGVVVVPDFVANAGALLQGAWWHLRGERVGAERLAAIGATTAELLARSAREGVPPGELALALARERVAQGGAGS